ncbi:hypothetical protein [Streptomyces lydicus]|uniref:hypothetical protein n=1 Tax=Streptomyces lydicus TaxID=47763 RepID=UPI0037D1DE07
MGRRSSLWTPCYLMRDGNGSVSRLADEAEATQLGMGAELLGHARAMLNDRRVSNGELRYLGERLTEALCDVLRIAQRRGAARGPAQEAQGDRPGRRGGG